LRSLCSVIAKTELQLIFPIHLVRGIRPPSAMRQSATSVGIMEQILGFLIFFLATAWIPILIAVILLLAVRKQWSRLVQTCGNSLLWLPSHFLIMHLAGGNTDPLFRNACFGICLIYWIHPLVMLWLDCRKHDAYGIMTSALSLAMNISFSILSQLILHAVRHGA
jgi:hypothetical protein